MGKQDEKFLMILDIDKVLTANEINIVKKTNETYESDMDEVVNTIPVVSSAAQNWAGDALA